MEASSRHADIAQFMEAQKQGLDTDKEMVWNTRTSKFELVDSGTAPDDLPQVTREDLQAFGRKAR